MGRSWKASCWILGAAALCALAQTGARSLEEGAAPPMEMSLRLENFEGTTLGARPFLWEEKKTGGEATIGAEKAELGGMASNKALKLEYAFTGAFNASQAVEAGPGLRPGTGGQTLPGGIRSLSLMVLGDGGKNEVALVLKDRQGELFEWRRPIPAAGWDRVVFPLDPRFALRTGSKANGVLDLPLTFEAVRIVRRPDGAAKGEVMVDNLTAECTFAKVTTLYDTTEGVKPEVWKVTRNHAVSGAAGESLVPRNGKDEPALKLEYGYENGTDASVEFAGTRVAGAGHGTLVAEVFGDGSNNLLRFRMLDGEDHVWQASWATLLVDWSGWKAVYLDTRTLKDPTARDPTALLTKFPVKFQSLIVDDCSASDGLPGVESGRMGEIYLGRLLFCLEK
jgi:hypothetical protein